MAVDEIAAWQSRPVDPVYPILYIDAIRIKIRDGGVSVQIAYDGTLFDPSTSIPQGNQGDLGNQGNKDNQDPCLKPIGRRAWRGGANGVRLRDYQGA